MNDACTPQVEVAVNLALNNLRNRITSLRDTVSQLEGRLECAMTPIPTEPEKAMDITNKPSGSKLAGEVADCANDVEKLGERLCLCISRLEI